MSDHIPVRECCGTPINAYHADDCPMGPTSADMLVDALAYALTRAQLPTPMETSRDYAERLVPLMLESGYLVALAERGYVVSRDAQDVPGRCPRCRVLIGYDPIDCEWTSIPDGTEAQLQAGRKEPA